MDNSYVLKRSGRYFTRVSDNLHIVTVPHLHFARIFQSDDVLDSELVSRLESIEFKKQSINLTEV